MENRAHGADLSAELAYFQEMWDKRASSIKEHTAQTWDTRAADWIDELNEPGGAKSIVERVEATAGYLRNRGLLQENDTVADIGCGPGLFVMEFAKTVKQAVGIDFSERFIEYGRELAAKCGVGNASFEQRDLLTLDVDAAGLADAFDLVFTSITPAITGYGVLQKLMKMSRAMCCNISFVNVGDNLVERVSRDMYGGKVRQRRDGMGFYTMLNLLFLSGYYPETHYCTIETGGRVNPSQELAEDIAFNLRLDSSEEPKILRYLEKLGETERHTVSRFGSILWDTRICDARK
ncbi:MAG: class I SAM-dependent methyltransferase [Oscillospiraceae bacterium]|nr:class I SAM-dependent methyltransferase [Oscillospiraceae bacterium]